MRVGVDTERVPYRGAKRLVDKLVAGLLLIGLAPLFALAFLATALDALLSRRDRGPLLYRETRISAGREFDLLKLRTLRRETLATQEGGEAHARLLEADPANLTWAGRRILKPWYLDELPQLWNVVRGDLSLVGPRPWPPSLVRAQLAAGLDYRLRVKAGWTGPVQVRKDVVDPERFTDLDLAYVEACRTRSSLRLLRHDLGILWQTLKLMIRGEGLRY